MSDNDNCANQKGRWSGLGDARCPVPGGDGVIDIWNLSLTQKWTGYIVFLIFVLTSTAAHAGCAVKYVGCVQEYKTALQTVDRELTETERQAVSKCEKASLTYSMVSSLFFSQIGPRAPLPPPVSRTATQVEDAFSRLLKHHTQLALEAGFEAELLATFSRAAVLPLLTVSGGHSSRAVSAWISQDSELDLEFTERLLCGEYCKSLICLQVGGQGSERITTMWSLKCRYSKLFDHLPEHDKAALFQMAKTGWPGPPLAAQNFLIEARLAFGQHGDDRMSALPALSSPAHVFYGLTTIVPGQVDFDWTLTELLLQANRRLNSFHGWATP